MSDYKNIKVDADAFEELRAEKPPGVNWSYYLTEVRTVDHGGSKA